jgi:signal transduction histidine kinase
VQSSCVLKLTPYRIIARQYTNVLLGTQIAAIAWHIGVDNGFRSPSLQYYYLGSLVLSWIVFRILENRVYSSYHRNLVFQYRNTSLIASLNHQAKQLEQEKLLALNANETIRRFYASAAHDIRQPVYALSVYSGMVKEDPSQTLELTPKIIQSCHAINALFQSLFDFEKIQLGQIVVVHEHINIHELFDELKLHFLPSVEDKNLSMKFLPLEGYLLTDAALMRSIFNHLIANAIRYTNEGGLLVAARKYASHISLEVWDTGIGIDGDHHDQVFDEFFKVNEQSSSDAGFGLGLSVVKRLTELIDGSSVTMRSRLGQGSVFRFKLPLSMYSLSGN